MVILVVGIAAIGFAVFTGLDYLYDFAIGVYRAKTTHDLEKAAGDLAKAITILGIQTVLAILFRGAKYPRTGRGAPIELGTPPKTPGIRYKPTVKQNTTYIAGEGFTSFWGDIIVSTHGSTSERAATLLHELFTSFLRLNLTFYVSIEQMIALLPICVHPYIATLKKL